MTNIDLLQTSGLPIEYDEDKQKLVSHEILLPTPEEGQFHLTYRGVKLPDHGSIFKDRRVRHDIIIVPPGTVNNKLAATSTLRSGAYEVLHGTAHFLLQNKKVSLHLVARPGERLVVPHYSQAINASHDTLIVSSIVSEEPHEEKKFSHSAVARGEGLDFIKNHEKAELKRSEPTLHKEFGPLRWKHMYHTFVTMPERFAFLNDPKHTF